MLSFSYLLECIEVMVSKIKAIEFSELDDPIYFGIYTNKDVSKINHFGLKYRGKDDKIKREDKRKIVISVFSILLLLFLFIISFI